MKTVSDLTAARRLLRHLSEPRALRRNPLVAGYFWREGRVRSRLTSADHLAAEQISGLVLFALRGVAYAAGKTAEDRNSARQYQIVSRYDLHKEARAAICSDLGLSRSHFYRERRQGLLRFTHNLRAQNSMAAPTIALPRDRFEDAMKVADRLREAGRFDTARDSFERLARSSTHEIQKGWALCQAAKAVLDAGNLDGAKTELESARKIVFASALPRGDQQALLGRMDVVNAEHLWLSGNFTEFKRVSEYARTILMPLARSDRWAKESLAQLCILLAGAHKHVGTLSSALAYLSQGADVLADRRIENVGLRTDLLLARSILHAYLPGGMPTAKRDCDAAFALATDHGLLRKIACALRYQSIISGWCGNHRDALHLARRAYELGNEVCGSKERYNMTALASDTQARFGEAQRSLTSLRRARRRFPETSHLVAHSYISEAKAYLSMHAFAAAVTAADAAILKARPLGLYRYVGVALSHRAAAEAALGKRTAAVRSIKDAIDILEHENGCYSLAEAYRVAAALCPSRKDQERYKQLRAMLTT